MTASEKIAGLRIIIVLGGFILGGAERQAIHLAKYLQNLGAIVQVWGFNSTGMAAEQCDQYSIPWRIVDFKWPIGKWDKLKNLTQFALTLRKAHPDVVLPYTMWPNVACGLIWRLAGAKLCIWNQRDEGRHRVGIRTEGVSVKFTPIYISNSLIGKDFLTNTYEIKPEKIHLIHNGISLTKPGLDRTVWRHSININENSFTACMVANIHSYKDHATLLYAWKNVVDHLRNINLEPILLIAGRFTGTENIIKALAFDLGLCGNVRFLGSVKDIPGLLNSVDLGVFSSKYEGCPNAVLECMASGLAVAGTDISGIREAVGPDQYDFLAPPEDADSLSQKIIKLATNPILRKNLGIANQQRIENEFSLQKMCKETTSLIVKGLKNN